MKKEQIGTYEQAVRDAERMQRLIDSGDCQFIMGFVANAITDYETEYRRREFTRNESIMCKPESVQVLDALQVISFLRDNVITTMPKQIIDYGDLAKRQLQDQEANT